MCKRPSPPGCLWSAVSCWQWGLPALHAWYDSAQGVSHCSLGTS